MQEQYAYKGHLLRRVVIWPPQPEAGITGFELNFGWGKSPMLLAEFISKYGIGVDLAMSAPLLKSHKNISKQAAQRLLDEWRTRASKQGFIVTSLVVRR